MSRRQESHPPPSAATSSIPSISSSSAVDSIISSLSLAQHELDDRPRLLASIQRFIEATGIRADGLSSSEHSKYLDAKRLADEAELSCGIPHLLHHLIEESIRDYESKRELREVDASTAIENTKFYLAANRALLMRENLSASSSSSPDQQFELFGLEKESLKATIYNGHDVHKELQHIGTVVVPEVSKRAVEYSNNISEWVECGGLSELIIGQKGKEGLDAAMSPSSRISNAAHLVTQMSEESKRLEVESESVQKKLDDLAVSLSRTASDCLRDLEVLSTFKLNSQRVMDEIRAKRAIDLAKTVVSRFDRLSVVYQSLSYNEESMPAMRMARQEVEKEAEKVRAEDKQLERLLAQYDRIDGQAMRALVERMHAAQVMANHQKRNLAELQGSSP